MIHHVGKRLIVVLYSIDHDKPRLNRHITDCRTAGAVGPEHGQGNIVHPGESIGMDWIFTVGEKAVPEIIIL